MDRGFISIPLVIVLVVILIGIGGIGYRGWSQKPVVAPTPVINEPPNVQENNRNTQPTQTVEQKPSKISVPTDIKFTGTIQAVENREPFGGDTRVKIDERWIIIGIGDPGDNFVGGHVTGFNFTDAQANIGKRAEVYAAKRIDERGIEYLTIFGDIKYYLKII